MGSTGGVGGGANNASGWKEIYDEKLPFLRLNSDFVDSGHHG